jgi:hypothetical protein
MMNVCNGNVVLDHNGEAVVELAEWFEALNSDFRYQLTTIGGFAPVYVAEEIKTNRSKIAGGKPGMKASWQVTGIRQDAYARAHRVPVEEEKLPHEQGYYLHPDAFGLVPEKGIADLSTGVEEQVERRAELAGGGGRRSVKAKLQSSDAVQITALNQN